MKLPGLDFLKSDKLREFIKKYKYLLIIGVFGAILIIIPTAGGAPEAKTSVIETEKMGFDVEEYEEKLKNIISRIDGAGSAEVMLYLKNGAETVYAFDRTYQSSRQGGEGGEDYSSSESRNIVKKNTGGSEAPVEVKTLYPVFGGAVVVCRGASNPTVAYQVTQAVASLTGLPTDKIAVLPAG